MEYTLYDAFDGIIEYITEVIYQFRIFFFGLDVVDSDMQPFIWFFFLTVPILFAAFEAIFDWLLPTFLDLRPMGVRRFFIPKLDSLKPMEVKSYKPVRSESFNSIRSAGFRPVRNKQKLSAAELKHFQILYQQKYNCSASPMELRRFAYAEVKRYGYVPSYTVFSYGGMQASVSGAMNLGVKGYQFIKSKKKDINDPDNYPDVNLTEGLENRGDNMIPDSKRSYHAGSDDPNSTFD